MPENVAVSGAREIEVAVLRQIDGRRLVGRRVVFDDELILVA